MSYCINPKCDERENSWTADVCHNCSFPLTLLDRYRLIKPLRPINVFDYLEVFEVEDLTQGNHKVMKVLKSQDSKLIELMEREAIVLQLLDHPGIPRVEGEFEDFCFSISAGAKQLRCLVMEKIEGQNLEDWLTLQGPLSPKLALHWFRQLVEILDHVHQAGFFHRDIKPSNIICQPDGRLVLVDFGSIREVTSTYLAKISGESTAGGFDRLHDITVVKTACYAPLEQVNGKAVPQSDFYALGRTFVYLLTGIPLNQLPEDSQGRLLWRNRVRHLPAPFANLIDDMMATYAAKRPPNTKYLLQYLDHLPVLQKLDRIVRSVQFRVALGAGCLALVLAGFQGSRLFMSKVYFDRAIAQQLAGKLEEARSNYEKALAFNGNNQAARNNLALTCQYQQDYGCAVSHYESLLKANPADQEVRYNLASLLDEQGQYQEAEAQYRQVIQGTGNVAIDALNNLARLKNQQGSYSEAEQIARQGLPKTQDNLTKSALYKNLGWALLAQKQYQQAEGYLRQSVNLDQRADTYCLLAQVQEAAKNYSQAPESWKNCLLLPSELPEVAQWRNGLIERVMEKK